MAGSQLGWIDRATAGKQIEEPKFSRVSPLTIFDYSGMATPIDI